MIVTRIEELTGKSVVAVVKQQLVALGMLLLDWGRSMS